MVMRKIVVVGDKTNSSGVILPNANSTFSVDDAGHKVALIGGPVQCLACKSVGTIAKAGRPRRMNFMGEVALEDDIVVCGCPVHPKLIANLYQTMAYDDQAKSHGVLPPPGAGAIQTVPVSPSGYAADTKQAFDDKFILRDSNKQPLASAAYAIERETSEFEYGETDCSGHTHLLSSIASAENINVYFPG